jgi:hypothetical protein
MHYAEPGRPGELPNFLVESVQLKHTLTGGLRPPISYAYADCHRKQSLWPDHRARRRVADKSMAYKHELCLE